MTCRSLEKIFVAMAIAIASQVAEAQASDVVRNGGFEEAVAEGSAEPAGWRSDIAYPQNDAPLYEIQTKVVHSGKYALAVGFKSAYNYAGAIQALDAERIAGKRIEISAYLRRSDAASKVGIWFSAKDAADKKLLYVNSYEQPVLADPAWTKHTLVIDVPKGARKANLGAAIYEADGVFWVDDISVAILGANKTATGKTRKNK